MRDRRLSRVGALCFAAGDDLNLACLESCDASNCASSMFIRGRTDAAAWERLAGGARGGGRERGLRAGVVHDAGGSPEHDGAAWDYEAASRPERKRDGGESGEL